MATMAMPTLKAILILMFVVLTITIIIVVVIVTIIYYHSRDHHHRHHHRHRHHQHQAVSSPSSSVYPQFNPPPHRGLPRRRIASPRSGPPSPEPWSPRPRRPSSVKGPKGSQRVPKGDVLERSRAGVCHRSRALLWRPGLLGRHARGALCFLEAPPGGRFEDLKLFGVT